MTTNTIRAMLPDTDTTPAANEFGFSGEDPIKPYPLDKINVGPGRFPSRLNARRIPLFLYLFMLDPNKRYGWGKLF